MRSFNKITDKDITAFEKEIGFSIPEDMRLFLLRTNGGIVIDPGEDYKGIDVEDVDEQIHPELLYGINTGHDVADILYWMEQYGDELPEKTLLVGEAIEHGFIFIICDGEDKGVYYWDDAFEFECSDEESNAYWIAEDFGDFLKKLGL